jgi:hypothetical protein
MKKLIIATSILFAFSSAFAQKPNVKPKVSKYQSKTADAKPSQSVPASSEAKPSGKPVGPSTKPAPVVKPTKASRPVGASSTRASQSAVGSGALKEKTNTPSKGVNKEKGSMNTMSNSRASQSAASGGALKEKTNTPSKGVNKEKGEKNTMSDSKASQSGVSGGAVKVGNKGKGDIIIDARAADVVGVDNSNAIIDAEYCKGWNDGFSKAFPRSKSIPNCVNNGTCKGYKCGYEAGMKKAEMMLE